MFRFHKHCDAVILIDARLDVIEAQQEEILALLRKQDAINDSMIAAMAGSTVRDESGALQGVRFDQMFDGIEMAAKFYE